jgi:hypothetical protein
MRPRATFLKRDREMKLKQKAADKQARKAARQNDGSVQKGPPIDWASLTEATTDEAAPGDPPPPPATPSVTETK